ncbi:hypothetical protein PM082_015792 [Marasmius tenuissimus]|nr:hypothetical protein PM082_015792 [Marasmius tenuissimus]
MLLKFSSPWRIGNESLGIPSDDKSTELRYILVNGPGKLLSVAHKLFAPRFKKNFSHLLKTQECAPHPGP